MRAAGCQFRARLLDENGHPNGSMRRKRQLYGQRCLALRTAPMEAPRTEPAPPPRMTALTNRNSPLSASAQTPNPRKNPANAMRVTLTCIPVTAPAIAPATPAMTAANSLSPARVFPVRTAAPSAAPATIPINAPSRLLSGEIFEVVLPRSGTPARGCGRGISGGAGADGLRLPSNSSISSAVAAKRSRRLLSFTSKVRVSFAALRSRRPLLKSNTSDFCSSELRDAASILLERSPR